MNAKNIGKRVDTENQIYFIFLISIVQTVCEMSAMHTHNTHTNSAKIKWQLTTLRMDFIEIYRIILEHP